MTTNDVQAWLDGYRKAWVDLDPEAAAALFTEDATYQEQPYEDAYQGQEGVRSYWAGVTATQSDVEVTYGTPFVDGDRVAAEFWVTMKNGGADITLAGTLLLSFAGDGRCRTLREYWHFAEGHQSPREGWGA
jgi:uncharacterized protein (TIGR02246 family)